MTNRSTIPVYKRLINGYFINHKKYIFIAFLCMIIDAVGSGISANLLSPMIDQVFLGHNKDLLLIITLCLLIVYFTKAVAQYYSRYLIKSVVQTILTTMQIQIYRHCIRNDLEFIRSQNIGRLVSRITNDIVLIRGSITTLVGGCTKYFLTIIVMLCTMFYINWFLACISCTFLLLIIYPLRFLSSRILTSTASVQDEMGYFTSKITNHLRAMSLIKSFGAEKLEFKTIENIALRMLSLYQKIIKFDSLNVPMFEILTGIVLAYLYWYGGNQICDGKMSPGQVMAFVTAFIGAYRPIKSLIALNVYLQETVAAANRIFYILDIQPNITNDLKAEKPKFKNPNIEFKSVNFDFNDNRKFLFNNLSFKLMGGKINAIVGYPGRGKTTIVNLLNRFFDHNSGEILIDNIDIRKIDIGHLRENISVLNQETIVFEDITIHQNISYGIEDTNIEDVIKVAKLVEIHDFIKDLPLGYDTIITDANIALSGAQKQKIAIARTFYKNAPILLLDEINNSLDNDSKSDIINHVFTQRGSKTVIMITHNLETIIDADHIVFLDNGQIAEEGTHQELMQKKQKYYQLYNNGLK